MDTSLVSVAPSTPRTRYGRISNAAIAEALRASHGIVSHAARMLGINPTTIYGRINKSDALQAVLTEEREKLLDLAEVKLIAAVERGEPWAIMFVLRTLGKHRGYTERHELCGYNGPIEITLDIDRPNRNRDG